MKYVYVLARVIHKYKIAATEGRRDFILKEFTKKQTTLFVSRLKS